MVKKMSTMHELRILVPDKIVKLLDKIEKKYGIRKEDLIIKTLIRILEDYLGREEVVST